MDEESDPGLRREKKQSGSSSYPALTDLRFIISRTQKNKWGKQVKVAKVKAIVV